MKRRRLLLAAACLTGAGPFSAAATQYTFTNANGDSLWNTFSNWSPHGPPPGNLDNGHIAYFAGTAFNVTAKSGETSVGSVQFASAGWTINGNATTQNFFTYGITSNGAGTNTIKIGHRTTAGVPAGFSVGSGNTLAMDGLISGGGGLIKNGAGTLTLNYGNTYSGTTSINAGTLRTGNVVVNSGYSGLGNSTSAVNLGAAGTQGTLEYTGNSDIYTRGFTVNAGGGRINTTTSGQTLTIGTNNITGAGTLTIGGAGNTHVTSAIQANALTKADGGTLTLSNTSTYAGATTVSGGKLVINGNISTSLLTTVQSNAMLGGSGTVGALTVNSNGTLSPGNSAGNLTVAGDLALAGTYLWELGALSTAPSNYDRVTMTAGNANLSGATIALGLGSFAPSADPFWQTNQTWAGILNNIGLGTLTGSFASIDNSAWSTLGNFTTTSSGNDVNLVWTAVPEPRVAGLLGGLGLLALLRRRR